MLNQSPVESHNYQKTGGVLKDIAKVKEPLDQATNSKTNALFWLSDSVYCVHYLDRKYSSKKICLCTHHQQTMGEAQWVKYLYASSSLKKLLTAYYKK